MQIRERKTTSALANRPEKEKEEDAGRTERNKGVVRACTFAILEILFTLARRASVLWHTPNGDAIYVHICHILILYYTYSVAFGRAGRHDVTSSCPRIMRTSTRVRVDAQMGPEDRVTAQLAIQRVVEAGVSIDSERQVHFYFQNRIQLGIILATDQNL